MKTKKDRSRVKQDSVENLQGGGAAMKIWPVLRTALLLVLLLGAGFSAAGYWAYTQKDRLLREKLHTHLTEVVPDFDVAFSTLRVESPTLVTVNDLQLREKSTGRVIARARRLRVQLDETELFERSAIFVERILVEEPSVLMERREDGSWNWQHYSFGDVGQNKTPRLPQVRLTDLQVQLNLIHGEGVLPAALVLKSPLFQGIPASAQKMDFEGDVVLPGAGTMSLSGFWDLPTRSWRLAGRVDGVTADQQLLSLAEQADPTIRERLAIIDQLVDKSVPQRRLPPAGDGAGSSLLLGTNAHSPRFAGRLAVSFLAQSTTAGSLPTFGLDVQIREGRLSVPGVPVALEAVDASFHWDNEQIFVELRNAQQGRATMSGRLRLKGPDLEAPAADFEVTDFEVGPHLEDLIPTSLQKFWHNFRPGGLVSATGRVVRGSSGRWILNDVSAQVLEGRSVYHRFQYPVTDIAAVLRQRPMNGSERPQDVVFDCEMTGNLGDAPLSGEGVWIQPGPEAEATFNFQLGKLLLDTRFRDALDSKSRRVIDSMDLQGTATAQLRSHRPAGRDQPTELRVTADLTDCRMEFDKFPWPIDDLSGIVHFNSLTKDWRFEDLRGRHGTAELTAAGTFQGSLRPGVLDLAIQTRNAQLDGDLYRALGESQQTLWNLLEPEGYLHLDTNIHWTAAPGQKPVIRFPAGEFIRGRMRPKPFPYTMDVQSAKFSFDPNDPRYAGVQHCRIHSFQAQHDASPISGSGWAELRQDGHWRVHLNDLNARNLPPDVELRSALPRSWREPIERLAEAGRVSVENSEMEFRGTVEGEAQATAGWDMNLRLTDCQINAGLDVTGVTGLVTARGTWDGKDLRNTGNIRLDTATVLDMPLTSLEGPYELNNEELILGDRTVFVTQDAVRIPAERRIQARAYGGQVVLDALVELREVTRYRLFTTINNARLERYAALHIKDQQSLQGIVNAWIFLTGDGDDPQSALGEGQLQISPAALYELPVVVQLFNALSQLNLIVPNRTAFDYAIVEYRVRDAAFQLDNVELVGDSLALRGRGRVGFGGDVRLDFFTRPARPRNVAAGIINAVVSGATQWVGVQVRGTTDNPQTIVRSTVQLDESLRQFLNAFNPAPGSAVPGLAIPFPVFPQSSAVPRSPRR